MSAPPAFCRSATAVTQFDAQSPAPDPIAFRRPGESDPKLDWASYFMMQALVAAGRSKDPDTAVGCVIADRNLSVSGCVKYTNVFDTSLRRSLVSAGMHSRYRSMMLGGRARVRSLSLAPRTPRK